MTRKRGTSFFRSDCFYQQEGLWYFQTPEQTQEGPFERRLDAENYLQRYITVMNSRWLSHGGKLSLLPLT